MNIIHKGCAVLVAAASLSACGPTVVGSNESSIMFGSAHWQNADETFSLANAHCRKFGRTARLAVSDSWSQQASYDCIPGQAPASSPSAARPAPLPQDDLASLRFASGRPRPDDIAVVIGNSDYDKLGQDIPAVPPARNDAIAMRRYAVEALGIREGNIIYLENATSAQLVEVFGNERDHRGRLFNWVRSGRSQVFVYYAGHGAPAGPSGKAMLVPVDASATQIALSGYPLDLLYGNLAKLQAANITVMLEACFSGASAAGTLTAAASPIAIVPKGGNIPGNITVITASAADQIASWDQGRSHGLLTRYFLSGISGEADRPPTGNGDGSVSSAEMEAFVRENVSYFARRFYGRDQTVQVWKATQ
jgi:hypothetical protein